MRKSGKREVLILTRKGRNYGMGHYKRMTLLKQLLKSGNIPVRLVLEKKIAPNQIHNYKIIILDSRDDSFPDFFLENRSPDQIFVAVDNRGQGRIQADVIWDTLPHFEMNSNEVIFAMERCLIHPGIFSYRGSKFSPEIERVKFDDFEKNKLNIDLIQRPEVKRQSQKKFYQNLLSADSVGVYFGQTFFEALFLGKKIYLYDISDYHKKLSDWFFGIIKKNPEVIHFLDGKGLERFFSFINDYLKKF